MCRQIPTIPASAVTLNHRFILFCLGSHGDVFPFLAVGKGLVERGHEVVIATNPLFAEMIREAGIEFIPVGDTEGLRQAGETRDINTENKGWKVALQWGAMGTMRTTHSIAMAEADDRTVMVAQGMCFGVRIARDQKPFPLATVHLDPIHFRSVYKSPLLPRPLMLDNWVPKLSKHWQLWVADRYFIDPVLAAANEFRHELGLPPVTRFLDKWFHSPDCVIGMMPDWYAAPQPDWPPQTHMTGFPLSDPDGDADEEAIAFVDQPEPVFIFAPGTAGPRSKTYFHEAAKTCEKMGARGLLLTRSLHLLPETLPPLVRHFEYVKLGPILKHAAVLVHHGGIGTVARALAEGVPQLISPKAFNQPDDARRVHEMGVGEIVPPEDFRMERIEPLLKKLTESPDVAAKCRQYAERLASENGVATMCDELEALAAKQSPAQ